VANGVSILRVNGKKIPPPDIGLKYLRSQLVDSGRNAQGTVIAQKINRRQVKVDSLKWTYLTAEEWHDILVEIEKFECNVTYFDALTMGFATRKMYWGDASEEPYEVDESGRVLTYRNCSCNIIDMGVV
jgi:hypothetical protein